MDKESMMPTFHLGFLAKMLLKSNFIGRMIKQGSEKINSLCTWEWIGSCQEHLRVYFSPHDLTQDHECCELLRSRALISVYVAEGIKVIDSEKEVMSENDIIADTSSSHPGYLRLITKEHNPLRCFAMGTKFLFHPPSFSDRVLYGLRCQHWPVVAAEWISRARPSGWPGLHVIKSSVDSGCLVVSRGHSQRKDKEVEWQYIFSKAERILALEALTEDMRYCFSIFKILVDFHLLSGPTRLKTTHLKTVMYFACEVLPTHIWADNTGGALLYLLQSLLCYLTEKKMPNYFIIDNNMLDEFNSAQLDFIKGHVQNIRSFPVMAMVVVTEHYSFIREIDLVNTVLSDVEAYEKHRNTYRSVQNVLLPDLLSCVRLHILFQEYRRACIMLDIAYKLILESTEDREMDTVPSFKEFVMQSLAAEGEDDKSMMESYLSKYFGITIDEYKPKAVSCQVEKLDTISRIASGDIAPDTNVSQNSVGTTGIFGTSININDETKEKSEDDFSTRTYINT